MNLSRVIPLLLVLGMLWVCTLACYPFPGPVPEPARQSAPMATQESMLTPSRQPAPMVTQKPTLTSTWQPAPTARSITPSAEWVTSRGMDLIGHLGGYARAVSVQGTIAYMGMGPELAVLDVSTPAHPERVGYVVLPDQVRDVAVVNHLAYVAADSAGLWIIDVSDAAAPHAVGFCDIRGSTRWSSNYARAVAVQGDYAYVAGGWGLRVVDVSDPTAPAEIAFYETEEFTQDVVVVDGYVYVSGVLYHATRSNMTLRALDVSDPIVPAEDGFLDTWLVTSAGPTAEMAQVGNTLYISVGTEGLSVVDVSDPTAMAKIGSFQFEESGEPPIFFGAVAMLDDQVYIADSRYGLRVVDVSQPTLPVETSVFGGSPSVSGLAVAGHYVYAVGKLGLQILDVSTPSTPVEVGVYHAPCAHIENMAARDGYAYVTGHSTLSVVDVAEPSAPVAVSRYVSPREIQDVAVAGDYLYVVDGDCFIGHSCDGTLRILDVSDPTAPTEVGVYDPPGFGWAVAVRGDYAYLANRGGGLRVVDISNPAMPLEVGFCDIPGFAMHVALAGDYAYVAAREGGLRIVDISNPAMPVEVGSHLVQDEAWVVTVVGQYAYVGTRTFGLRVVDVSNPAAQNEVGAREELGTTNSVAVAGNTLYAAADDGLWALDISDPTDPVEVGFYGSQIPGAFSGQVIYLDSTIYLASDGLMILRPHSSP